MISKKLKLTLTAVATLSAIYTQPIVFPACAETSMPSDIFVDEVSIEGNNLVTTDEILRVVKTKPGDKYDRKAIVEDLKAINEISCFDSKALRVEPKLNNGGVQVKIRVEENETVHCFSFQGNDVLGVEELQKLFADQLAKPQNKNRFNAAIEKVESVYRERGYVLARVTDVKEDVAGVVDLTISEGVIDDIQIKGNVRVKGFIVSNFLKVKKGQVYNDQAFSEQAQKLFATGCFCDIRRSLASSNSDPDKYTLTVEVEENLSHPISVGGGQDVIENSKCSMPSVQRDRVMKSNSSCTIEPPRIWDVRRTFEYVNDLQLYETGSLPLSAAPADLLQSEKVKSVAVAGFACYSLGGFSGVRGYRQFTDRGLGSNLLEHKEWRQPPWCPLKVQTFAAASDSSRYSAYKPLFTH